MGAWGHGILQNDTAQDGLCDVLHWIADDILKWTRRRPTEAIAARIGAGVGLLLHLSAHYWLNPENDQFYPKLLAVLERHQPAFASLGPEAARLLEQVRQGKGLELVERDGPPNPALAAILFPRDVGDFPMQRIFGLREPSLFAHPEAVRFVQEIADRCVAWIDKEFDDDVKAGWPLEETEAVGALGVLLEIEPCRVDPDRFASWRARWQAARAPTPEDQEDDPEVEEDELDESEQCLDAAFRYGIKKFAAS
jgi:hypothetical protein